MKAIFFLPKQLYASTKTILRIKWNEMQKKHCKMIQFLASFSKIQKDFCKISKTIKHKMHHCCQQQYFGHQIFLVRNQIKNLRNKISTNFGSVKKINRQFISSNFYQVLLFHESNFYRRQLSLKNEILDSKFAIRFFSRPPFDNVKKCFLLYT